VDGKILDRDEIEERVSVNIRESTFCPLLAFVRQQKVVWLKRVFLFPRPKLDIPIRDPRCDIYGHLPYTE
jgi:hypothetical protein